MNEYYYSVDGEEFDNSYRFTSNLQPSGGISWIVEQAAENYHLNHIGWERSWPIDFTLYLKDGTKLGTFSVEREYEPCFYAQEKE
jgi:hypothetical protein